MLIYQGGYNISEIAFVSLSAYTNSSVICPITSSAPSLSIDNTIAQGTQRTLTITIGPAASNVSVYKIKVGRSWDNY